MNVKPGDKVRIVIDPMILKRFRSEIYWILRQLFSSIGWTWHEVNDNASCDIAYGIYPTSDYRVFIPTDMKKWENSSRIILSTVEENEGWPILSYDGLQTNDTPPFYSNSRLIFKQDLIFNLYWMLSGVGEDKWLMNKHGRFVLNSDVFLDRQYFIKAYASEIVAKIEDALVQIGFPDPIPPWPNSKRAAACISHDVDYPEIVRWLEPIRRIGNDGIDGLIPAFHSLFHSKHHWHFESWMRLEKEIGARSAFYFSAKKGSILRYITGTPDPFYDIAKPKFGDIFRKLLKNGFEIGLHASYNAYTEDMLFNEKKLLETIIGSEIKGVRHHYWRLDPQNPYDTLFVHDRLGFLYDSTLGHPRYIGFRNAYSRPFFPYHSQQKQEIHTLQMPPAWMDDHLFGYKSSNPGNRCDLLRYLVETVRRQKGCFIVDIHNYVFDNALYPN